jgi:two-component sensor histidine kinase
MRALALAHEMIAESGWEGMSLATLLETELAPYRAEGRHEWRLEGPAFTIPVPAVQPLVLAVHELVTNAVKYGALKEPHGRLDVTWSVPDGGGLVIEWDEHGLAGLGAPATTGFGSRVLNQVLEMQLGARVDIDYRDVGLRVRIALPAARLREAEADAGGR